MTRHFLDAGALTALLGLAACGGENLVLPSEGEPAAIALVQGDGQSGRVGEALPQPLVFLVSDETGRPVAGARVAVELTGATPDPDTATTAADGRATVAVVLGGEVGPAQGSARVLADAALPGLTTEFTLTAVAASASGLAIVSGQDQSAPAAAALAEPLVVQVTDAFGNPIEGVAITWTVEGGGGVSAGATTTDADGLTSVVRTLGSAAGLQRTLASAEGLAGSPAAFLHTAVAGSATGVQIVSGNDQSGAPGARLAQDLVVRVADADGNPVSGAAVTWVVTAGGGRLDPPTSTTDAEGLAATGWYLGPQVGDNAAEAVVSGVGRATFRAKALAGTPQTVEIVSGSDQTAVAGQPLPAELVVRVLDQDANPVPGATVRWSVASGGGSVSPSSTTSDASGQAAARWTLGGSAGAQSVEASVSGAGRVTFRATATIGTASVLALRTQPSGTARVGEPFDRQPVVQLRDAAGNDVDRAGVAVTVAIASGPGNLLGTATRTTDGAGRATFTDLAVGGAAGGHTLIFAAQGFTSVTSSIIDVRPAATTTSITADDPDPSASGAPVTVRFTVTSAAGTPTGAVRVTTSAGPESCTADVSAGSCEITLGTAGSHTLRAEYQGSPLFEASSDTEGHQVSAPNATPVAADDSYDAPAGGLAPLVVDPPGVLENDSDPDGDPLQAQVTTGPVHGTVALSPDGGFTYTPTPGYVGDDGFSYRVVDGRGGEATATVALTVPPPTGP